MLVLLTVMTGLVDSVSYLALGNVFVANMTGNIIFLGFGLGGSGTATGSILSTTLSTLFFCAGASVGGHLAFRRPIHRGLLLGRGTALQTCALVVVALLVTTSGPTGSPVREVLIAILAVSMGWQYALVQRLDVPDFRTIVVTTTVTALVAEPGQSRERAVRRVLSIGALLLGAAIGSALIRKVSVAAPLWGATAVLLVVAVASSVTARRAGSERWR